MQNDQQAKLSSEEYEQQEWLRVTLSSIGDAVITTDTEGCVTFLNPVAQSLTGWTQEEAAGVPLETVFHVVNEETRRTIENPAIRALREGVVVGRANHTLLIAKDGTEKHIDGSAAPIRNAKGEVAGVVLVFRDITERKQAEEEAKQLSERNCDILESIADGFFALDRDWRFTYLNHQAELILDRKPGDLIGNVLWDVYPGLAGSEFEKAYHRTANEGVTSTFTVYYPDHDRWYEVKAYPAPNGIIVYFGNVTVRVQAEEALRENEQRLEFTLEAAKGGDWDLDLLTGKARTSLRHDQCFGASEPIPDWSYEKFLTYVHPDDRANEDRKFQAAVASGQDWNINCRVMWRDGSVHWIESCGRNYRYVAGKPTRMLGMVRDVTERKRAEMNVAFLAEISLDLARLTSVDEMMRTVGAKIGAYLNLSLCAFVEINEAADEAVIAHDWHRADVPGVVGVYRIGDFVTDEYQRVFRAGETFVVRDIKTDSRTDPEKYAAYKIGSFVNVPLVRDGQWRFLLAVYDSEPRDWRDDEIDLIRELTTRIWTRLERTRAEAALRESEESYRILAETASDAIIRIDENSTIEFVNTATERIFGYAPEEMFGQSLTMLMPEELRQKHRAGFGRYLQTGKRNLNWESIEVPARHKDGHHFPLEISFGEYHRDDKRFFIGIARNVTERRQAEELLRESEERFAKAFNSSPLSITITSLKTGKLIEVNETFVNITGYSREEAIGRTTAELSLWQPSVRDAELEAVKSERQISNTEYRFRMKDGSEIVGLLSAELLEIGGEPCALTVIQDITERKRAEELLRDSEEKFRDLANSISQFAWMADASGFIFWYNERWFEYTGTTLEEMRGWGWQAVHHPNEVERVTAKFKQHLASGEPWEDTFPLRSRAGEYRWFLSRAVPIRDETGSLVRWFGTNTDIEEVRQARLQAEAANHLKDEFLATLSHELRTPLTSILGWTRLLQTNDFDAEKSKRALETVERNARAQNQLIDDLLDVSRIITGKLRLDVSPVELSIVIEAAVDAVRPAAEARNIRLRMLLDPSAGAVSGDANRLQQVVWNLLTNAVKFTPKGGRVEVRLERVNSHVEIVVSDTGQGIAPEFVPHVFDRFRQADQSTTRTHGGLGLGLSIVRQLVEQHGGTVGVESEGVGQGTTFTVKLPRLVTVRRREANKTERVHPTSGGKIPFDCAPSLEGLRVLVVDDEPDTRELLRAVLEGCNSVVTTAGSAAEALAAFAETKHDVIVCDIGMPEEDGYALIGKVRALPAEQGGRTPAIALTAYARAEDRVRSLMAGFQVHVPKPIEPVELAAVVASLAGRTGQV